MKTIARQTTRRFVALIMYAIFIEIIRNTYAPGWNAAIAADDGTTQNARVIAQAVRAQLLLDGLNIASGLIAFAAFISMFYYGVKAARYATTSAERK